MLVTKELEGYWKWKKSILHCDTAVGQGQWEFEWFPVLLLFWETLEILGCGVKLEEAGYWEMSRVPSCHTFCFLYGLKRASLPNRMIPP